LDVVDIAVGRVRLGLETREAGEAGYFPQSMDRDEIDEPRKETRLTRGICARPI
jgi:hypothetical protein